MVKKQLYEDKVQNKRKGGTIVVKLLRKIIKAVRNFVCHSRSLVFCFLIIIHFLVFVDRLSNDLQSIDILEKENKCLSNALM